jgi:hypothetical protein
MNVTRVNDGLIVLVTTEDALATLEETVDFRLQQRELHGIVTFDIGSRLWVLDAA